MGDELALDHGAFRRAQDRLAEVHGSLREEHGRLSQTMRSLLGGGWTGEAARQYAAGWSEWEAGAEEMLDGLAEMSRALAAVHVDLRRSDDQQGTSLHRIGSRLGETP